MEYSVNSPTSILVNLASGMMSTNNSSLKLRAGAYVDQNDEQSIFESFSDKKQISKDYYEAPDSTQSGNHLDFHEYVNDDTNQNLSPLSFVKEESKRRKLTTIKYNSDDCDSNMDVSPVAKRIQNIISPDGDGDCYLLSKNGKGPRRHIGPRPKTIKEENLTENERKKRENKRLRNRIAASKFRNNIANKMNDLQAQVEKQNNIQNSLKDDCDKLSKWKDHLQFIYDSHIRSSNCQQINAI